MKIAYLILSHNNSVHFEQLISAISSSSSEIFIHIDKKADFKKFLCVKRDSLHFINKRIKVYRSHFSQVEAILLLMQNALEFSNDLQRFVLLSGTDYPLRSQSYIMNFFEKNPQNEYLNLVKIPNLSEGKPLSRLTGYTPTPTFPSYYLERMFRGPLRRLGIIPKERNYQKILGDMIPYGGSEWWALTRNACQHIIEFVSKYEKFVKFFKHSRNPEEMFFHIILGNSPYKNNIKDYLTYTDWSAGGGHPAWISMDHLRKDKKKLFSLNGNRGNGEFLFARKISDSSGEVVEKINEMISSYEKSIL